MRRTAAPTLILLVPIGLVAGLGLALVDRRVPLGVPGEWTWSRLDFAPTILDLAAGLAAVAAYATFAALGARSLGRGPDDRRREAAWLLGLWAAAVTIQLAIQSAAPEGCGLPKWPWALHGSGSSGYYTVARFEIDDARTFLEAYPDWVQTREIPRQGAHPPGLFLVAHGLLKAMQDRPDLADRVLGAMPGTVHEAYRELDRFDPLPRPDQASLILTGALTLVLCASTVVPLYLLARTALPPPGAWAAAALWPVVPSAIVFQPTADTAFPLLATSALALAAWSSRAGRTGPILAATAGAVLALGMAFSLVFLPIGLTVGLTLAATPGRPWKRRAALILATGLGYLTPTLGAWALTGANPFVVWWWNRANHAAFYDSFHRTYRAWIVVDLVELAVGLGLPAAVWALVGVSVRRTPPATWSSLAVLALLNFGGLTLSEVPRLWLPWMPALLVPAAAGLAHWSPGTRTFGAAVALMGVQTLLLEATIQVVYAL